MDGIVNNDNPDGPDMLGPAIYMVVKTKNIQKKTLDPFSQKIDQLDSKNKDMGVVLHDPGEGYQQPLQLKS